MGGKSRVAWHEGLFLRPQHFQQQDRYLDALMLRRTQPLQPYAWGVIEIVRDEGAAAIGKFAVERCSGILLDGTPFSIPEDGDPPDAIDIPSDCRDTIVYLTLPPHQTNAVEFSMREVGKGSVRELVDETEIYDSFPDAKASSETTASEVIRVSRPNLTFGVTRDQTDGRVLLGLAKIKEVLNKEVKFDDNYIPPTLDIRASRVLKGYLNNIIGRSDQRVDDLALRAAETSASGSEGLKNYLILAALNRWTPKLTHLRALPNVHPERLYEAFVSMAGELCTHTLADRRPPDFPAYDHERLQPIFEMVVDVLNKAITTIFKPVSGVFTLEDLKLGRFSARIDDQAIVQECSLYLAATANKPLEEIRAVFPNLVKVGSTLKMRQIVNSSRQAGVQLVLTTPPPEIRPLGGFVYFELDRSGQDYKDLTQAPGIGIHVAGDWPGLKLELIWVKARR